MKTEDYTLVFSHGESADFLCLYHVHIVASHVYVNSLMFIIHY